LHLSDDGEGNWGRTISRWFNPKGRKVILSIEDKAMYESGERCWVFHSLRHTFGTFGARIGLKENIQMRLMGHATKFDGSEYRRYAGDIHPAHLLEGLKELDYGLDLSPIMGLY
jgi:integrase